MATNTQVIELAGRNWLTAQLLLQGIKVAQPSFDEGIDLIAYKEVAGGGIRALPLQLKCARQEVFSLDQKYANRDMTMVYVWNVLEAPSCYVISYDEALGLMSKHLNTKSWIEGKGYSKNRKVSRETALALAPFRNRWEWLHKRLDCQPTSI